MDHRRADRFQQARRDPALAVLEGFHAVKHALRFGAELEEVVVTDPSVLEAMARRLAPDVGPELLRRAVPIAAADFARLAPQAPRTGVLAIGRRPAADLVAALADPAPRPAILLEEPRNLFNMGACVRVAAAAGAAAVLTTGPNDPWSPDAVRAGGGLHYALTVSRVDAIPSSDRPLLAVDPEGEPLDPAAMPARAVLAFGTERYGLSDALRAAADARISIPMEAGVSSLNLATSVAAVLFAWRLCRGAAGVGAERPGQRDDSHTPPWT